jgi:hypothetical protein
LLPAVVSKQTAAKAVAASKLHQAICAGLVEMVEGLLAACQGSVTMQPYNRMMGMSWQCLIPCVIGLSDTRRHLLAATLPTPAHHVRNPNKVNAAVIERLSEEQSAALRAATQRSVTYRLNKTTPDIYHHLISTVQQKGSLAGMLQAVGVPLCHLGYSLAAPAEGMELQYMQLTAARAVQVMQQHVQQVRAGSVALGWQLPAKPARPVLL